MKFSSYNIKSDLLIALEKEGYIEMTPIQEKSLPLALKGQSLLCKSATGSGKTHAFLIPLINSLDREKSGVFKLILVPTMELVDQCSSFLKRLEKHLSYFHCVSFSSQSESKDNIDAISNPSKPLIVISTPGRAKEVFLKRKKIYSSYIDTLVLDEADMLMEKSYSQDVLELYNRINPKQTLMYTATMKEHEMTSIKKALKINKIIEADDVLSSNNVTHHLVNIRHYTKEEALLSYLNIVQPFFALVFCSSKKEIEKVYNYLNEKGISSILLSGALDARKRSALLKKISYEKHPLILASDVASRGIDFIDVSHVISLDLPTDLDYYYHRAGRTGRNNKKGYSVLFIKNEDERINKLLKKVKFSRFVLKDDGLKEVKERKKPTPKKNENLNKEIRAQMRKIKSKTKTGQSKRKKVAIIKAKKAHKKKIIRENLKAKKNNN